MLVARGAGPPPSYRTIEGAGVNTLVDLGSGARTLVTRSPVFGYSRGVGAVRRQRQRGGVGILRSLGVRLSPIRRPSHVGCLRGGARVLDSRALRARRTDPSDLVGNGGHRALRCGIGDGLALWDVTPALEGTPLVRAFIASAWRPSARRGQTYHLPPAPSSRAIPAFADRGVPARQVDGRPAEPRWSPCGCLSTAACAGIPGSATPGAPALRPITPEPAGDARAADAGRRGGGARDSLVRTLDAATG